MMKRLLLTLLLAFGVFAFGVNSQTTVEPPQFKSAAEEQHFHELLAELRCVMCQNQSLADSNAQIAVELRKEVLTLMREGRSDDEVKAYLVQRYGEFVLYRPVVSGRNIALWIGPFALLAIALGGLWFWRRQHRPVAVNESTLSNDQKDIDW